MIGYYIQSTRLSVGNIDNICGKFGNNAQIFKYILGAQYDFSTIFRASGDLWKTEKYYIILLLDPLYDSTQKGNRI